MANLQDYELLERSWAEWNQLNPAGMVCCASGSAALLLALEALQLPQGNEVLVPDFTMIACPRAVAMAGLTPVFVDCDERLLMDPRLLLESTSHVVMPVHVYGRRCDMDAINAWAKFGGREMPLVVEDLAEAHGVKPHAQTDAACWSFFKNKIICAADAEGGAVWFRDPEHATLARMLRSLGHIRSYNHRPRGWNHRLSNPHAQLVLRSLADYGINVHGDYGRKELCDAYDRYCPDEWRMPARDALWVYDIGIPGLRPHKQNQIVEALLAAGIEARHGFKSCHRQQEFVSSRFVCNPDKEPESIRASREVIYLPCTPGYATNRSVELSFQIIRRVLGE